MAYLVDKAVIEEAYAIITKNRESTRNKKGILGNFGAIAGAVHILKFRNEDGTYTRVTSNSMPAHGLRIMREVKDCLAGYVREKNRIEEDKKSL